MSLWEQVKAAVVRDNVPTGLFIQSLNEMIDNQEKRLTAMHDQVPSIVLLTLYAVPAVSSAFAGYANGLEARPSRLPVYVMVILVSAVILLIQDRDRPNTGFITVDQQPMVDTADAAASMAAYSD
jgi:hypothetical protein